jgi:hypothetical protein
MHLTGHQFLHTCNYFSLYAPYWSSIFLVKVDLRMRDMLEKRKAQAVA